MFRVGCGDLAMPYAIGYPISKVKRVAIKASFTELR